MGLFAAEDEDCYPRRVKVVLILAALVLVVGGIAAIWNYDALPRWLTSSSEAATITVSGNIEAHQSVLGFKTVQSRIRGEIITTAGAGAAQTRPDALPRCNKSVFLVRSDRRGSMEHVRGIFDDPENLEYGAFRAKRDPTAHNQ
jgi:hypothetical protein